MNENTPSNGWNGKSRLTHPHNRCMNNFLYDWLYSRPHPGCMILYILLGGPKWGNLSSSSWLLQRVSPSTDHRRVVDSQTVGTTSRTPGHPDNHAINLFHISFILFPSIFSCYRHPTSFYTSPNCLQTHEVVSKWNVILLLPSPRLYDTLYTIRGSEVGELVEK